MAYPFLPVNPCCTDVVINDVCGCSSVITNSGCNTNDPCSTTLTASSTVIYNGPALTCTTAEPCDTLNVVLQKIDEVICNLLSQISTLTTQVNNINSQILIINNDISDIQDTLDVCCGVTTTTTTTVYPYSCTCINITIDPTDLDDATGNTPGPGKADNTVYLTTTKGSGCDGSNIDIAYNIAGLDGFCIKTSELSTIQLFYYKNDNPIYFPDTASTYNILYANCSVNGECIPT